MAKHAGRIRQHQPPKTNGPRKGQPERHRPGLQPKEQREAVSTPTETGNALNSGGGKSSGGKSSGRSGAAREYGGARRRR